MNKKISIKQLGDTTFVLKGISLISSRSLYKLKIYLSSIQDVKIEYKEDDIIITFQLTDGGDIAQKYQHFYSLMCRIFSHIEIDEQQKKLLQIAQDQQEIKNARIDSLRNIKSNGGSEEDFLNFVSFCNNNLVIRLHDYQYRAAYQLCVGRGGFDFSVPGAGKTVIAYTVYAYLKSIGFVNRVFVIGPISSYNAWYEEYITCFGKEPDFISLTSYSSKDCNAYLNASSKNHHEITFINVDKIRLIYDDIISFLKNENALLIIDEAHKIKDPNAKSSSAAFAISKFAKARILLTGTPMPNGYEDLFSLMKVFSPFEKILPYSFPQLKAITKQGASQSEFDRIKKSIDPYYSRISKKYLIQTGQLTEPVIHMISVQMEPAQRQLYDRLNDFCGKISDDIDEDFLTALKKAVLIRKMQISANPGLLKKGLAESMDELYAQYAVGDSETILLTEADNSLMEKFYSSEINKIVNFYDSGVYETTKNEKAAEIAEALVKSDKKVLVWDIFVGNMTRLQKILEQRFPGIVELVNGSVSVADRQQAIKRFREGNSMILVANPATLAESISLHKTCQNAIYVNRNFNCAQYMQSKDRIHRINMPEGTTANYYYLFNEDSVDESVGERLSIKEGRMLKILDEDNLGIGGSEMDDESIMSSQDVEASFRR